MTTTTLKILAGVERRLDTLLQLETTSCGFEENSEKCDRQRERLMRFIETEVEKAVDGKEEK